MPILGTNEALGVGASGINTTLKGNGYDMPNNGEVTKATAYINPQPLSSGRRFKIVIVDTDTAEIIENGISNPSDPVSTAAPAWYDVTFPINPVLEKVT